MLLPAVGRTACTRNGGEGRAELREPVKLTVAEPFTKAKEVAVLTFEANLKRLIEVRSVPPSAWAAFVPSKVIAVGATEDIFS